MRSYQQRFLIASAAEAAILAKWDKCNFVRRMFLLIGLRYVRSEQVSTAIRGGLNGVTGQPWARVSNTRAGDVLICDDAFTCVTDNEKVVVCEDADGLYFRCAGSHDDEPGSRAYNFAARNEQHYLDGQIEGHAYDEFYIGLNHADRSKDSARND